MNDGLILPECETTVTRFTVRCGQSEHQIFVRYRGDKSEYSVGRDGATGWVLFDEFVQAVAMASELAREKERTRIRRERVRSALGKEQTNDD